MFGSFLQHNPGPSIPLLQPLKGKSKTQGEVLGPLAVSWSRYVGNLPDNTLQTCGRYCLGFREALLDVSHSRCLDDLAKGWAAPAASLVGQVAWYMGEEILDWLSLWLGWTAIPGPC